MPQGIASASQLAMMERVVEEYCHRHTILLKEDREEVAIRVLALFDQGFHEEEELLARMLE